MITRPSNRPSILRVVGLLIFTHALLGCRSSGEDAAGHGSERSESERPHEEEKTIHLTGEQIAAAGITFAAAAPGTIDAGVDLLGEIRPNGDQLAHVVPRFPGIVREVRRTIGDGVRSGDTLAVIESSESLAPYELKTLIDGLIIEKHLTRGEAVSRESEAFVVADLSTVWVDLSIYQKDLPRVRLGQSVRVHAGESVPDADGQISYITPSVDQLTRTATARVVLPNPDGRWRPGMFVTARAFQPIAVPLAIPHPAVQTVEGRTVVFVESAKGVEPRPVTLGREGGEQVEVLSGLAPGERFAATKTFLLKAELGKGEAEHED